jgi:hypothetical protein
LWVSALLLPAVIMSGTQYILLYDIFINYSWIVTRGSTHLHTSNTQNNTNNNRTTQITNSVEECGPCPVFVSFTLAFGLQLRKKYGKTSVRVRETSVSVEYTHYQNTYTLQYPTTNTHITKPTHKHTHYKTHTYTPHTHTHYKTI